MKQVVFADFIHEPAARLVAGLAGAARRPQQVVLWTAQRRHPLSCFHVIVPPPQPQPTKQRFGHFERSCTIRCADALKAPQSGTAGAPEVIWTAVHAAQLKHRSLARGPTVGLCLWRSAA
jgi:hypothetical protein